MKIIQFLAFSEKINTPFNGENIEKAPDFLRRKGGFQAAKTRLGVTGDNHNEAGDRVVGAKTS